MTVAVRAPTLADVDRLAEINVDTWRSAYRGIVPDAYLDAMDLGHYQERWVGNLTEDVPRRAFFVADVDGDPAGYGICGEYRTQQDAPPGEDTDGWGEVYALYTDPRRQRLGVGGAIHDAMLAFLREGHVQAAVWVLEANAAAQEWYAKRGWRSDGSTSRWACADELLPEIRMRHTLDRSGRGRFDRLGVRGTARLDSGAEHSGA